MPGIRESILEKSALFKDEIISLRRHFHSHPELSFRETMTASFIESYLRKNGIMCKAGIAGTGIIARIDGTKGTVGRVVAARAEMDALPITETNEVPYKSLSNGIMHACSHDANLAMLLGAARIMSDLKSSFSGTILLVFQPGEEKSPGGARLLIETGVFDSLKPDLVIAQHALPELESGRVGYKSGTYMASCDEIYIDVCGKGGHAALPGLTTDQIFIASKLVIGLKETIAGKQKENGIPTVLGIGRISGEGATNVIPAKVEIAGTFRTFDEKWRSEALGVIRSVCAETALEFGVTINVRIAEGYPVLVNDEKLTEQAIALSRDFLGSENVEIYSETRMSSDDFSFYSALAPSLYFRFGIREKGAGMRKLHTSDFDIDENGLESAACNLCWLLYNFLEKTGG
jgi:amidohydrolase